jgi:hypothetical protein
MERFKRGQVNVDEYSQLLSATSAKVRDKVYQYIYGN